MLYLQPLSSGLGNKFRGFGVVVIFFKKANFLFGG